MKFAYINQALRSSSKSVTPYSSGEPEPLGLFVQFISSSEAETVGLQPAPLRIQDIKDNTKSCVSNNNSTKNYYNICSYNYLSKITLLLLQFGGRSIMTHFRSISKTLYYVLGGVCVCFTGVGLFMNKIVPRQELAYTVKKFGLCNAFLLVTWTFHVQVNRITIYVL